MLSIISIFMYIFSAKSRAEIGGIKKFIIGVIGLFAVELFIALGVVLIFNIVRSVL